MPSGWVFEFWEDSEFSVGGGLVGEGAGDDDVVVGAVFCAVCSVGFLLEGAVFVAGLGVAFDDGSVAYGGF